MPDMSAYKPCPTYKILADALNLSRRTDIFILAVDKHDRHTLPTSAETAEYTKHGLMTLVFAHCGSDPTESFGYFGQVGLLGAATPEQNNQATNRLVLNRYSDEAIECLHNVLLQGEQQTPMS